MTRAPGSIPGQDPGGHPEKKAKPRDLAARKSATMSTKLADTLAYPPRILRSERAAAYLSMSKSHFEKLVEQGRLPKGKKLGGIVFWDRLSLDAFVDNYEGENDAARIDDEWSTMLRGRK
jgi:predicted DNA-binding transcriptional regulator AlpA